MDVKLNISNTILVFSCNIGVLDVILLDFLRGSIVGYYEFYFIFTDRLQNEGLRILIKKQEN